MKDIPTQESVQRLADAARAHATLREEQLRAAERVTRSHARRFEQVARRIARETAPAAQVAPTDNH